MNEVHQNDAPSAACYSSLIDGGAIGVFVLRDGCFSFVNKRFAGIVEQEERALIGRPFLDLVEPDDQAQARSALSESTSASPVVLKLRTATERPCVCEIHLRADQAENGDPQREALVRDITQQSRLMQLHRSVLGLGEVILGEHDIDRILQLVLDTITEYSGFRRAVLSLYDLSIPVPFDGDVIKILSSGLSADERHALAREEPMPVEERQLAFDDQFRLGPAYYIPHDRTPWGHSVGLEGTVTIDGWDKDDYLFIPLRGTAGIIGSISVDDPVDRSAPTIASIEPVAYLANFAALAVERVFKLHQLRRHKERLHGLWAFASELARVTSVETLCNLASRRILDDMDYDYCAIWIVDGTDLVKMGLAAKPIFPAREIPPLGLRAPVEADKGITRWAVKYGEPVIVPDVQADSRYNGTRSSIRSVIAIPLIGVRGPLGVIGVESRQLAAFGEQDLEILSALANQMTVTIAALHRHEALQRINAHGQRLVTATTVEQVVAGTLDFLTQQFDYHLCVVFLCDENGTLEIRGCRGSYADEGVDVGWVLPDGKGVVSWVARNRRPVLVSDVTSDPRYYAAFSGTRSELAVPVLSGDQLLGILNVESPRTGFFDDEDRQLLEVVSNHLGIALSNIASQASLREQAIRDPLTGLYNRHYFNSVIAPELSRSDRYDHPLTLMMIDLDAFRTVNNRYGHLKGDDVLSAIAHLLEESVRSADRVIRYGGDEFLIFMPETREEADAVASRLRQRLPRLLRQCGIGAVSLDLSIGVYVRMPDDALSLESILEEVDRRMYADKRGRRQDRADEYRH